MVKTFFRILLAFFSLTNFAAFQCSAKYSGGTGTAAEPYRIYTAEDMNDIGLNENDWDKHFVLMNDIDLGGFELEQFNVIGDAGDPFSGVFDGHGWVISNFTYDSYDIIVGLFKVVGDGGIVKNLGLINPDVSGTHTAGPLAGSVTNGRLENCWVIDGSSYVLFKNAGGITGNITDGVISNCYCLGTYVEAEFSLIGGLAGENYGGLVINSFAVPSINGPGDNVGALIGEDVNGLYTGCFWDSTVNDFLTGIGSDPDPNGVIEGSTTSLQQAATFVNASWDIVTPDNQPLRNIWRMCENGIDYPHLAVEYLSADFACPDGIDIFDLAVLTDEWALERLSADVDFNSDLRVDFTDWAVLAAAWKVAEGSGNYNADVDVYHDGIIDEADVVLFAESWLGYGLAYLNADIEPYVKDGFVNFADFAAFANFWFDAQ